MRDAEYVFMQDCKEKKNIGKSMHAKKSKSKGCRLPSDNLTKKERSQLSGEARTYAMGKPKSFADFKAMPTDLQQEYILKLRREYEAREVDIAEMFGIQPGYWLNYKKAYLPGLPKSTTRGKKEISLKWVAFFCGESAKTEADAETDAAAVMPAKPAAEVIQAAPEVEGFDNELMNELMAPVQEPDIVSGSLNLSGHPEEIFHKVLALLDLKKSYKINITFEG